MRRSGFLVLSFLLGACAADRTRSTDPRSEFTAEVRLDGMLPPGWELVGLAASPEGKVYVLDKHSGLYEVGTSRLKLVFGTSDGELSRFGLGPTELTDVVALGDERFALTAENDGYLLDLHNDTFTSYFCYLPASPAPDTGTPQDPAVPRPPEIVSVSTQYRNAGIQVKQRTESVAFSPRSLRLFAQPRTIRVDTAEVVGSELFVFPESGGQPMQVMALADPGFLAGGMVAVDDQSLLLGVHDRLYEATGVGLPALLHTFQEPFEITGMARATDGNLLLLDSAGARIVALHGY